MRAVQSSLVLVRPSARPPVRSLALFPAYGTIDKLGGQNHRVRRRTIQRCVRVETRRPCRLTRPRAKNLMSSSYAVVAAIRSAARSEARYLREKLIPKKPSRSTVLSLFLSLFFPCNRVLLKIIRAQSKPPRVQYLFLPTP